MFERIKFLVQARKVFFSWGGNPRRASFNEVIVSAPVLTAMSLSENSSIFSNKYVCADAVLIAVTYAGYHLEEAGAPQEMIIDLLAKTRFAIKDIFKIDESEAKELVQDRFVRFSMLLSENTNDVKPMIKEAQLLFAHDLHHDKYVEFGWDSPVVLVGFDKQFLIQSDTTRFFANAMPSIMETLDSYFSLNNK